MWKLGAGAVLAMTTVLGGAAWGQVLTNGDFEIGGLSGWSCTGADYCATANSSAFSGSSAFIGVANSGFGTLSQSFATSIGATYRLSFAHLAGSLVNVVRYSVGGGATVEVIESGSWTEVVQDFVASGATSNISLFFETDSGTGVVFFDAVSVILLALGGPTTSEELASLLSASGGAARLVVLDAQGIARDMGEVSLATRDGQLIVTPVAPGEDDVMVSSKSAPSGLVGNVYTWAQITGFDSNADTGPGGVNGAGFQIGADVAIGADMVAGLSLGYSEINSTDGSASQDGSLTYLQPYMSYRSGQWYGNASLIYGKGDYDQTSTGGDGTGETDLFAFTYEGGYDIDLQNGLTVTPTVGLIHGREDVEGTGGTLAGSGSESYDFTQASLGARVTSRQAEGTFFAGLHADYLDQDTGAVLTGGFLSENGWSGRIEVGGSTDLDGGLGLSTSVDISGLGGSAQTLSGGLRVSLSF